MVTAIAILIMIFIAIYVISMDLILKNIVNLSNILRRKYKMGYDYGDAWNELKDIFHKLKPNEESEIPIGSKNREWIRNKMKELEKLITN